MTGVLAGESDHRVASVVGVKVYVIGVGADGAGGLPAEDRERIGSADVVVGGSRHLQLVEPVAGQQRHVWPRALREDIAEWPRRFGDATVVVLASGDPLIAGVGATLVDVLGEHRVEIRPAVSSVALARAALGWPAETVTVLRQFRQLPRHLFPGQRILVLSADETTPGLVAELLQRNGFGESRLTVLGELGGAGESRIDGVAAEWDVTEIPRLNIVAVAVAGGSGLGLAAGLPDVAFDHDGQLTKRDVRASALSRLAPAPGELLWDVGAGAGSVGIEWMRHHRRCRAVAVEADTGRAERIVRNAETLGVPGLQVAIGRAPEALSGLESPDAIFVGGAVSRPGVLECCWEALPAGGRLVAHAVTLESEARLTEMFGRHGGELMRLRIESAEALGGFTGWTPRRAVTQWAVTR